MSRRASRRRLRRGKVHSGLLVSGIGSLSTLSAANPAGPEFPPPMQPTEAIGPFEIVSIAGTIGEVAVRDDRLHPKVHAHISVSGKDGKVPGGSLRPGSKVFWKAQVLVQVLAAE
ncbi:MAG: PPC domain-containing DNA-binding protein [Ignavibacteriales bacterium]